MPGYSFLATRMFFLSFSQRFLCTLSLSLSLLLSFVLSLTLVHFLCAFPIRSFAQIYIESTEIGRCNEVSALHFNTSKIIKFAWGPACFPGWFFLLVPLLFSLLFLASWYIPAAIYIFSQVDSPHLDRIDFHWFRFFVWFETSVFHTPAFNVNALPHFHSFA